MAKRKTTKGQTTIYKTPCFVNYKKGALDSQPQVIKFTGCLPMVGGSLLVLQLKYCWKWR